MKKTKIISIILSVVLCFSVFSVFGFAETPAEKAHLKFNDNSKFTILNYSDLQGKELDSMTRTFIEESVKQLKPDLVVLTGDNIEGKKCKGLDKAQKAIDSFMSIFEKANVPTAVVFGNHDHQCDVSREEQIAKIYSTYSVNLTYDEGEEIEHTGTYNIPIYASDDSHVAFNIWMMDTGSYCDDFPGYDAVRETQLNWYEQKSKELERENGSLVPSICFQHIIVPEIYDFLKQSTIADFDSVGYQGKFYSLGDTAKTGSVMGERASCSGHNGGQFETMKNRGDVLAIVSGHDHTNSFVVSCGTIDLVNTATSGFGTYGNSKTRGVRVFTLDEKNPTTYETSVYLLKDCLSAKAPMEYVKSIFVGLFKGIVAFFNGFAQKIETVFGK